MKRQHFGLLVVLIGFAVFPFGWLAYLSPLAKAVGHIFISE